jgi:hypothetical protein
LPQLTHWQRGERSSGAGRHRGRRQVRTRTEGSSRQASGGKACSQTSGMYVYIYTQTYTYIHTYKRDKHEAAKRAHKRQVCIHIHAHTHAYIHTCIQTSRIHTYIHTNVMYPQLHYSPIAYSKLKPHQNRKRNAQKTSGGADAAGPLHLLFLNKKNDQNKRQEEQKRRDHDLAQAQSKAAMKEAAKVNSGYNPQTKALSRKLKP